MDIIFHARWNMARLQHTFQLSSHCQQEIAYLPEALVLHETLVAVLFILGIRRAVETRDDNNKSAPVCGF
jgi:hypothetical protein